MKSDDAPKEGMCKAERLAIAGAIAPVLRSSTSKRRRIGLVDADGKVVGYKTLAEVQEALLAAEKIAIQVQDGIQPSEGLCERCGRLLKRKGRSLRKKCGYACKRPEEITCQRCGDLVPVPRTGRIPKFCTTGCKCACGARLHPGAFSPHRVAKRKGAPPRCRVCARGTRHGVSAKCQECGTECSKGSARCRPCLLRARSALKCRDCGSPDQISKSGRLCPPCRNRRSEQAIAKRLAVGYESVRLAVQKHKTPEARANAKAEAKALAQTPEWRAKLKAGIDKAAAE